MCYALPGVVTEISGRNAVISYFGEIRSALCELTNVRPGDYVYAQGGYVIEKVDPDFAREMLDTWNELFLVLQERDTAMSERPAPEPTEEDLPVMREAIVEHLGGSSLINVARAAYRIAARRRHIVPLPAVPQELMDRLPDEETLRIAAQRRDEESVRVVRRRPDRKHRRRGGRCDGT